MFACICLPRYVLKPGETVSPDFLNEALAQGNAVQDHLTNNVKTGRTGNETLRMAIAES